MKSFKRSAIPFAAMVLSILTGVPVYAARRKAAPVPEVKGPVQYTMPVEQSEISDVIGERTNRQPVVELQPRIAFGASTWAPHGLQVYSYQGNSQPFTADRAPRLSGAFLMTPFKSGHWQEVSVRAGMGYLQLGRDQTLTFTGGRTENARQVVHLLNLELGAEWAPAFAHWKALSPYLGAGVLPTLGFTTRSSFDNGTSIFGFPLEFTAGVGFKFLPRADFDLGVLSTVGAIGGSDAFSLGLQAGLRMDI